MTAVIIAAGFTAAGGLVALHAGIAMQRGDHWFEVFRLFATSGAMHAIALVVVSWPK